ncbi:unnamed protein product [Vitrella brassicaformis CCMP3155]|uniref:Uncharacterized protein n=1 Tax=Vitrella brassicaformis (strain CCMP3155) TaxID=1169540 RepID=A0A0G4H6Y9_VITBC|nr:unnamed protein product [Vitrella brassicaformis CCMP3155]|eukprot:CEM39466.1 unnamed protein product [Vitrella brassicaformis CCMP3155]
MCDDKVSQRHTTAGDGRGRWWRQHTSQLHSLEYETGKADCDVRALAIEKWDNGEDGAVLSSLFECPPDLTHLKRVTLKVATMGGVLRRPRRGVYIMGGVGSQTELVKDDKNVVRTCPIWELVGLRQMESFLQRKL